MTRQIRFRGGPAPLSPRDRTRGTRLALSLRRQQPHERGTRVTKAEDTMTKRAPMIEPSVFTTMTLAALAVAALSGCGREDATGSAAGLTAPVLATQGG